MCQELTNELTKGTQLAKGLCEHLQSMSAESVNIPVVLDGRDYMVIVRLELR